MSVIHKALSIREATNYVEIPPCGEKVSEIFASMKFKDAVRPITSEDTFVGVLGNYGRALLTAIDYYEEFHSAYESECDLSNKSFDESVSYHIILASILEHRNAVNLELRARILMRIAQSKTIPKYLLQDLNPDDIDVDVCRGFKMVIKCASNCNECTLFIKKVRDSLTKLTENIR